MEQIQLELERKLQTCHGGQDTLDALVDHDQVAHIGTAQTDGLLDLFVLSLKNAGQSLLLLSHSFYYLGYRFAAAVMTWRYGLNGFHRVIGSSLMITHDSAVHSMCRGSALTQFAARRPLTYLRSPQCLRLHRIIIVPNNERSV